MTAKQERIQEYHDRYWKQAINADPADRERAEKAALQMAKIAGVTISKIKWVNNLHGGGSPSNALCDLLRDSLSDLLSDPPSAALWAWLSGSLRESLDTSLSDSLNSSLWDPIWDSFWNSIMDSGWLALYTYIVDELGINCSHKNRELLSLYNELAVSCFMLWILPGTILPGTIVLCERPESVEIKDEKLVSITWRK